MRCCHAHKLLKKPLRVSVKKTHLLLKSLAAVIHLQTDDTMPYL